MSTAVETVRNCLIWTIMLSFIRIGLCDSEFSAQLLETSVQKYMLDNIPLSCRNESEKLFRGLSEYENWALKMLDASAKIPSGILEGNIGIWFGSYEECLSINEQIQDNETKSWMQGKYCHINIPLNLLRNMNVSAANAANLAFNSQYAADDWSIKIGICIPRGCKNEDIQTILGNIPLLNVTKPTLDGCFDDEKKPFDAATIIVITIWATMGALLAIGTLMDLAMQFRMWWIRISESNKFLDQPDNRAINISGSNENGLVQFVMLFSMYTNGKILLSVDGPANRLSFLNGIRFLSIAWIVLGHTFATPTGIPSFIDSYTPMTNLIGTLKGQLAFGGLHAVDTFLFISGLLVTYVVFQNLKKDGHINPISFYLHRYWRLLPPLAMLISWVAIIEPFIATGPASSHIYSEAQACRINWWRNLIFLNNFRLTNDGNDGKMCIAITWYLAVDFQLYVLSPIVLYPLYKRPIVAYLMMALIIGGSLVTNGILTDNAAGSPLMQFENTYIMPYCRLPPYVIGMLVGYILQKPDFKLNLKPVAVCCCWVFITILSLSIIFGPAPMNKQRYLENTPVTMGADIMNNTFSPLAWSICLAWITVACAYDYGGIVKGFLDWKVWRPWARISYCIYLLHPIVLSSYIGTRVNKVHYDLINFAFLFLSVLMMSAVTAMPFSLAFESPMIAIEKFILTRRRNDQKLNHLNTQTTPYSVSQKKTDKKQIELTIENSNKQVNVV